MKYFNAAKCAKYHRCADWMRVIAMRPVWFFALATSLVLALHPAQAQMSPSLPRAANPPASAPANAPAATAPAGTLVAPPAAPAPADAIPPATAGVAPPASASASPEAAGAGGICQCLAGYGTGTRAAQPYENNGLGLRCTAAVDDCKSVCQTQSNFAFVPNAVFSCHGTPPAESTGKVALNLPRRYPATRR
jgi:hypothetical protein